MKNELIVRMLSGSLVAFAAFTAQGQCDRWQQRVGYTMNVDLNDTDHKFVGTATLKYTNNSKDTLDAVFFHLYFNAFQSGSEMDIRSRTIEDPDGRVGDRIARLLPHETGQLHVVRMTQAGAVLQLTEMGTVLKVDLKRPILPGKTVEFKYEFNGQVPIQIRRSGRDNAEGVAYSMAQWYPKIAEYDERGWHADPYVGREFFGVWGDFDVTLKLDSAYTIASTGELENAHTIGRGYASKKPMKLQKTAKTTWHFVAKNVHDFAWSADKDYVHTTQQVPNGPLLHFIRKNDPETKEVWDQLPDHLVRCFEYMNTHFGKYPWPQFTVAQGGDGGMEYPSLTLMNGKRRLGSLVGTAVHESIHSWYYGALASNESRYPWMDEGFAEYAGSKVMNELFPKPEDPHASAYAGYYAMTKDPNHEPPAVHGDHFKTNRVYSTTAYSFGEIFVQQLGAVVGEKKLASGLMRYFNTCKMKHPEPIDFERVMEKESGLELDWYFDEWINTTRTLDYGIKSVLQIGNELRIQLERKGDQLMPVDLRVTKRDGTVSYHHIPLSLMLGSKPAGSEATAFTSLDPWQWTDAAYELVIPMNIANLQSIELDPYNRLADIDRSNDLLEIQQGVEGFAKP